MRADEEKSAGGMESLLAPFTPAKPISLMQRQIYPNVQENESNLDSFSKMEAYMSRVSQENQAQVSAEGSNNIHYPPEIVGNANRAVGWTPLYGPPTQLSASTSNINPVLESLPFTYNYHMGHMLPRVSSTDPLGQWSYVTFSDLLAMNTGGVPAAFGGSQTAMTSNAFLPNLNSQAHLMFEHQGIMGSVQNIMAGPNKTAQELQGLNQHDQDRTLELNQRIENHQSGFSISSRNSYDLNSYPEPENALTSEERPANMMSAFPDDGLRGFAPVTPDNFKKIVSSAPGETYSPADMQNAKHSEVLVPGVDSLLEINETRSATDSIVIESYHPDKESNHELQLDLDQNKPTQQKTRRKKHRPKVVIEGKPKRPPTQRKPGPGVATETPRQKRKYIRKNKTNMPSKTPPPAGAETLGSKVASPSVKSCRKTLNFDLEDQANEDNFFQISSNMASSEQLQHIQEEKDVNEAAHGSDAFDINVRNNQILKDCMSIPERDAQNVSQPTKTTPTQYDPSAAIESESGRKKGRQTAVGSKKRTSAEALHPIDTFTHSSHYTTCASTNEGEHNKSVKWTNPSLSDASNMASHCPTLQVNHMRLGNAIFSNNQGMYFPVIYKKRRTEKVFKPNTLPNTTSLEDYPTEATNTSKYYYPTPVHCNLVARPSTQATATHHLDKTQFRIWADIDKLKRKRSKVTTRVRNLDSLKGLAECRGLSRSTAKQRVRHISTKDAKALNNLPSMEALPVVLSARRTGKRQSRKRRTKMKSIMSSFDILFGGNSQGPSLALPWKDTTLVDAVIEGMKQLNINKEGSSARDQHPNIIIPYSTQYQQQNALVLYKRDGTMIPFKESEANKFKAKVDLDDETIRVWKLLLEDINSQGIDGTDEEKKKWWKTERNVFHGRVDSFIARMRLVQGDRHFSPWKGSVVDSVVGVFLTQNVSDHLSSSAFMTVAARFPLKSGQEIRTRVNENIGPFIEEPDICSIDLNDNIESLAWNEKTVEGPICDRNSRTLHDLDVSEEKVVNSKESHGSPSLKDETFCHVDSSQEKTLESQMYGGSIIRKESEIVGVSADATSSQHSVISSQSSAESPSAPTSGTMGSVISSEGEILTTNSNPSSLHCSASFVELLRMAETPKLNVAYSPKDQALSYQSGVPDQEGIREDTAEVRDSYSNVNKCPTLYQLCMTEGDNIKGVDEESRSVNSATSTKNLSTQQTKTTVSRSNESPLVDNVCSYYVLEGEELIIQQNITNSQEERSENSPKSNANPPTLSMVETDVTESTCASNITVHNEFIPNQPFSEHNHTSRETQNVSNKDTTKKKKGTAKKAAYDWESLRKRAQVNGKSRQHTANTMDSVDWEAVRHADVNDVADTIKDRGMNNVLAERIQAFLNRIVKDHGSIDLEWLRDIPPDKAKEYLLSINGIGLKSVECVRLLTLHQLAFPVDTNVGRIAVRLGWVPLQPLPESLQLHLLEMYPILESIQKYLWPRLCKLDQRTLYELHYHMITFGKVFCTKKQPNCNACPLRGECRHFASAFTSSKLALPGPEDKSIVPSCKSNVIYQDPRATINYLPMPLPIEDHMLEVKSAAKNYEPIVEIPASPEPEQIQTSEYDIEDALNDDPNEIPTIKLNMEEFSHNLQTYMQSNMELQEGDMSKALVALATEAASIPTPKLKNVNRLRTEHRVYELPDTHQLLRGLDKREPDDPCSYLLAIWTPGETANSIEAPEKRCNSQEQGELCGDETCFYCNSLREANKQTVRGTLLIPCRTAMRGSFPLNGTYFQVNEVFADHDSSLEPIEVPREWIWNLPRRTVYFGTSIPSIFKGLPTEGIQHCFWKGYVCVRGFDRKTRAPRPLMARLHFPASKTSKNVKEATNVQRERGNQY